VWKLRKVAGGSEAALRVRATLDDGLGAAGVRRGVGPVSLQFTIPMLCASRLQVPARPQPAPMSGSAALRRPGAADAAAAAPRTGVSLFLLRASCRAGHRRACACEEQGERWW